MHFDQFKPQKIMRSGGVFCFDFLLTFSLQIIIKSIGGKGGKGGKVGKSKRPATSRSTKAGLQFPVGRIHRFLKQRFLGKRIGSTAPVYLAAVLEYISAEVLELAGNASKDFKCKRITPRHLQLAIRGDDELDELLKGVIAGGGVAPHIQTHLFPSNSPSMSSVILSNLNN